MPQDVVAPEQLRALCLLVGFSFIANGIAVIVAGLLLRTLKDRQPPRPDVAIAP
jgi:hypothetical protein